MDYEKGLSFSVEELTLEQKCDMYEWCIKNNLMMENDGVIIQIKDYPLPDTEQLTSLVKTNRDSLISQVEWRRTRHQDEVTLGMEPTEPLLPILEYIQALREVPRQEGFPVNVVWPVPPWESIESVDTTEIEGEA